MPRRSITSRCCSAPTGTRRISERSVRLAWNRYGKSRVRLVKVRRGAAPDDSHDLVDLTLDIALEGAFDAVYVDGDNSACLATDTMKNTAYAFARRDPMDHVEAFTSRLANTSRRSQACRSSRSMRSSIPGSGCRP